LAAQVRRVDWVRSAGELGAMLLEAQWIKTLNPTYNRRVKSTAGSFTLRLEDKAAGTVDGAATPATSAGRLEPVAVDVLDPEDLMECFGAFHSEKDACKAMLDIAHAHQLCLKVLGFEVSAGSCFAFQVGKCKGACVGREPLLLHSTRTKLALSSLKLKSWPFPGRIALRERAHAGMPDWIVGTDLHIVDNWVYLGTARMEEELDELGAKESSAVFDINVYKILVRYFANHAKLDWIDLRRERTGTAALAVLTSADVQDY